MPESQPASPLVVACLCAAWCGTCRDYRAGFDALATQFGAAVQLHWIDTEDDEALLGDIDVEDFPTLLLGRGGELLFFGTVLPHVQTLVRMVQSASAGDLKPQQHAEAGMLLRRLAP